MLNLMSYIKNFYIEIKSKINTLNLFKSKKKIISNIFNLSKKPKWTYFYV